MLETCHQSKGFFNELQEVLHMPVSLHYLISLQYKCSFWSNAISVKIFLIILFDIHHILQF